MSPDLSQFSMHDLFRLEVDGQREVLTAGLLKLEREPTAAAELEACMRSAHSLKGAARIVGLSAAVVVAHAMEDAFVAAQRGALLLDEARIGLMLRGLDLLVQVANTPEAEAAPWQNASAPAAQAFLAELAAALAAPTAPAAPSVEAAPAPAPPPTPEVEEVAAPAAKSGPAKPKRAARREPSPEAAARSSARERRREVERRAQPVEREASERRNNIERHIVAAPVAARAESEGRERTLRVAAQNLNRLLGLSGEALVESRWVAPFAESLLRLKRMQVETGRKLALVQERLPAAALDERTQAGLSELRGRLTDAEGFLAQRLEELELYDQRSGSVARRLYDEAIACRMRPFADRIGAFPRLVRDLGVELHKRVQLHILGEDTQVDRDVLDKLEAPLSHLLRNAVDHGMESPAERERAGKPAEGRITLEARHAAGMLQISVSDDGRGIDLERVRATVVQRGLSTEAVAGQLTEAELLEFLFLPGFTVRDTVTEISGRGVGLDAVQDMVKQLRGSLRVSTDPGRGARFQMHLPLTVSVVRALVAEIGGEPYAFPLAFIANTVSVPRAAIQVLEGRQHFQSNGRQVGLVSAVQVLGGADPGLSRAELPVVVVGDHGSRYGLVVDGFHGVRELVVQPLDPRLGKIKDISSGALLDNGTPVLIVDTFDLLRSIDKLIATGHLDKVGAGDGRRGGPRRKRVLVVEDSLTVRELERKLIEGGGFEVEVAVDGADGWNAVRVGHFDLVVTDVDMPRMDGIALVSMIKQDQRLAHTPVMIVSYKDREEDRRRGLEAGADFYLTKGSFHDETLLQAVRDLVGGALAEEAP
jgi:two-component system sensor histidine kinase and response regulator WspE